MSNVGLMVETITPEFAKKIVEFMDQTENKNWRGLNKAHVKALAEAMSDGRWVLNGETIKFDENGYLVDGQHRIAAVIESGVAIKTAVAYGVGSDEGIDTGKRRLIFQYVGKRLGYKYARQLVGAIRRIIAAERGRLLDALKSPSGAKHFVSDSEVLNFIERGEFEGFMSDLARATHDAEQTRQKHRWFYAPPWVVIGFGIRGEPDLRAAYSDFLESVLSGRDVRGRSMVPNALWSRLIDEAINAAHTRRSNRKGDLTVDTVRFCLTVKAWNYYVRGEASKTLRVMPKNPLQPIHGAYWEAPPWVDGRSS